MNMAGPWQLMPFNTHLQFASAPQGKALSPQSQSDADTRRQQFRDATAALCEDILASAIVKDTLGSMALKAFYLFPKLAIELRLKIWQHAIDVPRFIEVYQVTSCFSKIPPPLLYSVCRESHHEVKQAYGSYHTDVPERSSEFEPKARWVRFEHDIIHIKPTSYPCVLAPDLAMASTACAKIGREWTPIRQYQTDRIQNVDTDRWMIRPARFDRIKTLAISRDLLVHLPDDYECFVRHFFPKLLLLIVLIDDETDIDEDWGIHDLAYGRYEKVPPRKLRNMDENPHAIPRFDFAKKCKGPFKEVTLNVDYRMDIEYEMRKRFTKEESMYLRYTAPRIRVLGARPPKGVCVEVCGRLPPKPPQNKKRTHVLDPFGDFINDGESPLSALFSEGR